jgi:type VI secretion system secreted protein Hcp
MRREWDAGADVRIGERRRTMAVDIYLQLPGILGTSLDKDHKDWIELTSATWGVEQPKASGAGGGGAGSGAGPGKAKQHPLVVTAPTTIATPLVFEAVAKGTHFATAQLDVVQVGSGRGVVVIRWEFEDVTLARLDVAGAEPGFDDVFELRARRTRMTVFKMDAKGRASQPVTRGWDFPAGRPF